MRPGAGSRGRRQSRRGRRLCRANAPIAGATSSRKSSAAYAHRGAGRRPSQASTSTRKGSWRARPSTSAGCRRHSERQPRQRGCRSPPPQALRRSLRPKHRWYGRPLGRGGADPPRHPLVQQRSAKRTPAPLYSWQRVPTCPLPRFVSLFAAGLEVLRIVGHGGLQRSCPKVTDEHSR